MTKKTVFYHTAHIIFVFLKTRFSIVILMSKKQKNLKFAIFLPSCHNSLFFVQKLDFLIYFRAKNSPENWISVSFSSSFLKNNIILTRNFPNYWATRSVSERDLGKQKPNFNLDFEKEVNLEREWLNYPRYSRLLWGRHLDKEWGWHLDIRSYTEITFKVILYKNLQNS